MMIEKENFFKSKDEHEVRKFFTDFDIAKTGKINIEDFKEIITLIDIEDKDPIIREEVEDLLNDININTEQDIDYEFIIKKFFNPDAIVEENKLNESKQKEEIQLNKIHEGNEFDQDLKEEEDEYIDTIKK